MPQTNFGAQIEKIGAATYGAGVISLARSTINLGNNLYDTGGVLTLTVGSVTNNTVYYVYAQLSGSSVILVQSTNAPSVGPGGTYRLVAAYLSNGSNAFGAFINITGSPCTDWFSNPTCSPNAAGWGTTSGQQFFMRMVGGDIHGTYYHVNGTVGASGASITLPSGLTFDGARLEGGNNYVPIGEWYTYSGQGFGSSNVAGALVTQTSNLSGFHAEQSGSSPAGNISNVNVLAATGNGFCCFFRGPISGWTNVQLIDR